MAMATVIPEYEVFKNGRNALAFFFAREAALDANVTEGPFWFTVEGDRILAGTGACHAVFEDVRPDVIDTAESRGVILMVEFENKQPVRCTPCYFSDRF
mgnify:CR=1 FL=1